MNTSYVNPATVRALKTYKSLLRATENLQGTLNRQLESFELTMGQFHVLEALLLSGSMTQKALCEKILCSAGNMAFLMRKLTERGLVERKANERDERSRRVELTREGREVIIAVYPRHANVVRALMATLKVREQETLERLCRKVEAGDPLKFIRELTMIED